MPAAGIRSPVSPAAASAASQRSRDSSQRRRPMRACPWPRAGAPVPGRARREQPERPARSSRAPLGRPRTRTRPAARTAAPRAPAPPSASSSTALAAKRDACSRSPEKRAAWAVRENSSTRSTVPGASRRRPTARARARSGRAPPRARRPARVEARGDRGRKRVVVRACAMPLVGELCGGAPVAAIACPARGGARCAPCGTSEP